MKDTIVGQSINMAKPINTFPIYLYTNLFLIGYSNISLMSCILESLSITTIVSFTFISS